MNALSSQQVANFLQDRFVATYLKVGTFQIVGDRKVGGNVASYFCLPDGRVLHAVPGPANAQTFLREALWAREIYRKALTAATDFSTGEVERTRLEEAVKNAHVEAFLAAPRSWQSRTMPIPSSWDTGQTTALPLRLPPARQQDQVHWLLARRGAAPLDEVYPIVWQEILRERLSSLPIAMR